MKVEQIAPSSHQVDRTPPACASAAGHDSDTVCVTWPARHPRPVDRPRHCAETTRGAAAIRCPAPAGGRRPARTGPDPTASPYGSCPAASTRTDPAAVRATASKPASAPLPWPTQLQLRQLDVDD